MEKSIGHKNIITSQKNMDGMRKKRSKDVKAVEQVDIISELPDTVIHQIYSFIPSPKEAARTSTLSKRWRDAWKSFALLTFDEESFLKTEVNKQKFIDFVDNSIEQKVHIYKLVLRITPPLVSCLNRWIDMAGSRGLRELDIGVDGYLALSTNSNVPPLVFPSATTLTGLRLQGLNWSKFQTLMFSNLQKLYLGKIHVVQQIFHNLVCTSPLIVDLRVVECHGVKGLKISGFLKLERLDLYRCRDLKRIDLQVSNLQTFWYCGIKHTGCKLNMESCISLKRLTLMNKFMTHASLNQLLLSFPVLEKLELSKCRGFKSFTIPNVQLQCLALRNCNGLKTVRIDSVKPCSFDCDGRNIAFLRGRLCIREAKFSIVSTKNDGVDVITSRNSALYYFLGSHCREGFKIIVWFHKDIIIHDDSKNFYFPDVLSIKVHIIKSSTNAKDLLNGLLMWYPEKIIVVASSPSSDVPKALHEIKRCKQPSCCIYNSSNRCWRHFLKDAKIVDLAETEGLSGWFHGLDFKDSIDQITSMQLHWEPSVQGVKN